MGGIRAGPWGSEGGSVSVGSEPEEAVMRTDGALSDPSRLKDRQVADTN